MNNNNIDSKVYENWKIGKLGYERQLIFSEEKNIAFCGYGSNDEAEANATLIVKAVNNHYKLIEVLKDYVHYMERYRYDEKLPDAKQLLESLTK